MLPSVGDKNAFAGICTLSDYFLSSVDSVYEDQFKVLLCEPVSAWSKNLSPMLKSLSTGTLGGRQTPA